MIFVDSNVWLYALLDGEDQSKRQRAISLIRAGSHTVSPQVINEVCHNLRRKGDATERDLCALIQTFHRKHTVTPITEASMLRASELRERYSVSFWDSQIVACALLVGCTSLVSEDMDHGLVVEGVLTIHNPFR
jgi:predicted nucleic acid-binding protein